MVECRICRAIANTNERPLPREVEELEQFGGAAFRLRRCPSCGSYYSYYYDHDNGGGTSEGSTEESLTRLTPADTIDAIRDALSELPFESMPTLEADLERLLREHPQPEEPIDVLIQRLDQAVAANDILGNASANLAAWSLGRRNAVQAIPSLERALGVYYLRAHAARALASMGAAAVPPTAAPGPEPEQCRICRAIPDRADADDGLPAEYHELQHITPDLCRCPLCGAYYDYDYGYYPGDGVYCDPVTDEVVTRLTPAQTIERIRRALRESPNEPRPTLERDLERLLRDQPGPAEPGTPRR